MFGYVIQINYKSKFIIRLLGEDFSKKAIVISSALRKFVKPTSFLRSMRYNRLNDFFYPGNAVYGEPAYGLADNLVRTAEAFANEGYIRLGLPQNCHYLMALINSEVCLD